MHLVVGIVQLKVALGQQWMEKELVLEWGPGNLLGWVWQWQAMV
jgi:hypothetical protein